MPRDFPDLTRELRFTSIPVQPAEAATYHQLPHLHKDPFDRMLIWQAQQQNLTLINNDSDMQPINVKN